MRKAKANNSHSSLIAVSKQIIAEKLFLQATFLPVLVSYILRKISFKNKNK
jgi:hypothetical protein